MKTVWKLLCLLGFIALIAVTALACAALLELPPQEALRPVLSVGILLVAGCAVCGVNSAVFTKRHTAATGFG